MSELNVTVQPDEFCALCGADDETSPMFVGGFLTVSVVFQRAGNMGSRLADMAIAAQDAEDDGTEEGFHAAHPEPEPADLCPECGAPVRGKSLQEGGGVECSAKCGWWECY